MDLALSYNPNLQAFDLSLQSADMAAEDTLASVVMVSLLTDRLARPYEVPQGQDPRGWWADSFNADRTHLTGSRLWLLAREKQVPGTLLRCKQYCEEALEWLILDGLVSAIGVTVFALRAGWLVAMIRLSVNNNFRNYRFEFDAARQVWRLVGEKS